MRTASRIVSATGAEIFKGLGMHFVILGGGALGSILAAHLLQAQHSVTLVARGARAQTLAAQGLRLEGLCQLAVPCAPQTNPSLVTACDVFINTVKTYDTAAALAPFAQLAPKVAFSVQNGVMKEAALAQVFGAACVVGAMADFSGELGAEGTVTFTRNVCLHLGAMTPAQAPRVAALVSAVDAAGIVCQVAPAITEVVWSKYVGWVALMLMAVLTRQRTVVFLSDPDSARVVARITREMGALAAAQGIGLRDQSPVPALQLMAGSEDAAVAVVQQLGASFAASAPAHRMSTLQDVERGRPLEVEETAGYALALARSCQLELPTLALCYQLAAAVHRAHLAMT